MTKKHKEMIDKIIDDLQVTAHAYFWLSKEAENIEEQKRFKDKGISEYKKISILTDLQKL